MSDIGQRDALLRELVTQINQGASGTLFVATTDNQAISLGLTDGWLTYCTGGRANGHESVLRLARASVASFSFTQGGLHPFRPKDEVIHYDALAVLQPLIPPPVPASDTADEAAESEDDAAKQRIPSKRMYRGQPVAEPESSSPASTSKPPTSASPRNQVRYYRGQPVRDTV